MGLSTRAPKPTNFGRCSGSTSQLYPRDVLCRRRRGLELTQTAADGEKALKIWPYQITSGWEESTVTWNSGPSSASAADPATTVNMTSGLKQWDVSKIVQGWRAGAKINGILLTGDGATVARGLRLTRERIRPGRLTIYYHKPAADTATPTATRTRTRTPTPTATRTSTPTATPTTPVAGPASVLQCSPQLWISVSIPCRGGVDRVETSVRWR